MSHFSKKLNILFVGVLPPHPGGAAISCAQLLNGLADMGHRLRALAPITQEAIRSDDDFMKKNSKIDLARFVVPYFRIGPDVPSFADYQRMETEIMKKALPRLIKSERPDVVLIGTEAYVWSVPDIVGYHSIPSVLCVRSATTLGVRKQRYPETWSRQWLEQRRKVTFLVTPARFVAEASRELGFDNIEVIPNGVDLNRFFPGRINQTLLRKLGIRQDEKIVLHASNLKEMKRPLDIVYSAERVLDKIPNVMYVVVGDGPCRRSMEEACNSRALNGRFRFPGWVEYGFMPDYIRLADIVLIPSESEAQARVYLETQACAKPLLASDIPSARELVTDCETGFLFQTGDINDLTVKTIKVLHDTKLCADVGHRARERVRLHAIEGIVAGFSSVLEKVVREYNG
jgi:glycosyltransferase involved in cell wall biosynthesis